MQKPNQRCTTNHRLDYRMNHRINNLHITITLTIITTTATTIPRNTKSALGKSIWYAIAPVDSCILVLISNSTPTCNC